MAEQKFPVLENSLSESSTNSHEQAESKVQSEDEKNPLMTEKVRAIVDALENPKAPQSSEKEAVAALSEALSNMTNENKASQSLTSESSTLVEPSTSETLLKPDELHEASSEDTAQKPFRPNVSSFQNSTSSSETNPFLTQQTQTQLPEQKGFLGGIKHTWTRVKTWAKHFRETTLPKLLGVSPERYAEWKTQKAAKKQERLEAKQQKQQSPVTLTQNKPPLAA